MRFLVCWLLATIVTAYYADDRDSIERKRRRSYEVVNRITRPRVPRRRLFGSPAEEFNDEPVIRLGVSEHAKKRKEKKKQPNRKVTARTFSDESINSLNGASALVPLPDSGDYEDVIPREVEEDVTPFKWTTKNEYPIHDRVLRWSCLDEGGHTDINRIRDFEDPSDTDDRKMVKKYERKNETLNNRRARLLRMKQIHDFPGVDVLFDNLNRQDVLQGYFFRPPEWKYARDRAVYAAFATLEVGFRQTKQCRYGFLEMTFSLSRSELFHVYFKETSESIERIRDCERKTPSACRLCPEEFLNERYSKDSLHADPLVKKSDYSIEKDGRAYCIHYETAIGGLNIGRFPQRKKLCIYLERTFRPG